MCEKPKLPTTPGSVVWVDGFLMLTRWGNWVSDAVFTLTVAEVEAEGYRIIFDAGDPEQEAPNE